MLQTDAGDGDAARYPFDRRAVEEARVAGLYGRELEAALLGRSPTDVVVPNADEEPQAYAERAVREFLRLYVRRWHGGSNGCAGPHGPVDLTRLSPRNDVR